MGMYRVRRFLNKIVQVLRSYTAHVVALFTTGGLVAFVTATGLIIPIPRNIGITICAVFLLLAMLRVGRERSRKKDTYIQELRHKLTRIQMDFLDAMERQKETHAKELNELQAELAREQGKNARPEVLVDYSDGIFKLTNTSYGDAFNIQLTTFATTNRTIIRWDTISWLGAKRECDLGYRIADVSKKTIETCANTNLHLMEALWGESILTPEEHPPLPLTITYEDRDAREYRTDCMLCYENSTSLTFKVVFVKSQAVKHIVLPVVPDSL